MGDVPSLLSTQIAAEGGVLPPGGGGAVNSEKRPLLEFLAPISFFTHDRVEYTHAIDRRGMAGDTSLLLSRYNRQFGLTAEEYLNIAKYRWNVGDER